MAAGKPIIEIEGDVALTKALARLETKALRKLLPKAAKDTADIVVADYKTRVPVVSGAMRNSVSKKVRRYKHTVTGEKITRGGRTFNVKRVVGEDIGASVVYDINKLTRYLAKRGKSIGTDKKRGGPFRYPYTVELGTREQRGERPLTKALYQNEAKIRQHYVGNLRALVAAAGAT